MQTGSPRASPYDIQFLFIHIKEMFPITRQWVTVTGTIDKEFYPEFEGEGPVIRATKIEPAKPAEEELVYFN